MKELPTKEQILDDCHREIMQGIVPGSTRGFPIAYAPQSLCAMERYAALRAMPLVEALKLFLTNIDRWLETGIPATSEESKSIYDTAKKALSSFTGGADTQYEPEGGVYDWILIHTAVPPNRDEVLVTDGKNVWLGNYTNRRKWGIVYDGAPPVKSTDIIAWRALPKPPKAGGADKKEEVI